jgi:hypothetical protein
MVVEDIAYEDVGWIDNVRIRTGVMLCEHTK